MSFREVFLADKPERMPFQVVETKHGSVEVRSLTAERFDLMRSVMEKFVEANEDGEVTVKRNVRVAAMLIAACHDPSTGEPLFDEKDAVRIASMPFESIRALFEKANEMNTPKVEAGKV